MSNKLVGLTDNVVVGTIEIMGNGAVKVQCPTIPPAQLIKIMQNLATDLTFASFEPAKQSTILQLPKVDEITN